MRSRSRLSSALRTRCAGCSSGSSMSNPKARDSKQLPLQGIHPRSRLPRSHPLNPALPGRQTAHYHRYSRSQASLPARAVLTRQRDTPELDISLRRDVLTTAFGLRKQPRLFVNKEYEFMRAISMDDAGHDVDVFADCEGDSF